MKHFFPLSYAAELTSTTMQPTTELVPESVPTGVAVQKSLPQVVPFWVISAIVVVAAIAISVTLFFLCRWNSRYSESGGAGGR